MNGSSSSSSSSIHTNANSPSLSSSSSPQNWDSLRKQAKLLESELESKLVNYSKAGSSVTSNGGGSSSSGGASSSMAPVGGFSSIETTEREIDGLIRKLTTIIDSMASFLDLQSSSSNPSMMHMLQRHRDILYDYSKEFKRTKSNIASARDHAELLSSVREDINMYKNTSMQDYLLTERNKIDGSHNMADQVLEQAYETRDQLDSQRRMLFNSRSRLSQTLSRFPMIQNLIGKINTKKRRDAVVMACVI
ncbi:Golgi SNAP receptor complex member 1, partial [Blyttiomyces sp. JEL0837]